MKTTGEEQYSPFGQCIVAGLPGPRPDDAARRLISRHGVGNFILFGRNVEDPLGVEDLCAWLGDTCLSAGLPSPLIAVDQEGGPVQRLKPPLWTSMPSNRDVALAPDPVKAVIAQAEEAARRLSALGVNLNLAPVLDLSPFDKSGVLAERTYGDDPHRAAELGATYIRTLQGNGVIATAKHFPGIGRVGDDPHHRRPVVPADTSILADDLLPFRSAVQAGVGGVMTSHVVFPAYDPEKSATFSRRIAQGLLRDELGFSRVLITDDLEMGGVTAYGEIGEAAVAAFLAGHDLLLVCHREDRVVEAIRSLDKAFGTGLIPEARLEEALSRIRNLKERIARKASLE